MSDSDNTRIIAEQHRARSGRPAQRHLRDRRAHRVGRHGRGLSRPQHPDRRAGRDQDHPAGARRPGSDLRAVQEGGDRSSAGSTTTPSSATIPSRATRARPALSGDGVRRRRLARRPHRRPRRSAPTRCASCSRGVADGLALAHERRRRPSRPVARQHHPARRRCQPAQDHRLRHRAVRQCRRRHADRRQFRRQVQFRLARATRHHEPRGRPRARTSTASAW